MRTIILALCTFIAFSPSVRASELGIASVKQPIYLLGSGADTIIRIVDVPFVTLYADPEWRFSAICQPFVPPTEGSWQDPHDVNLTSLYGIGVSGTYKKDSPDIKVVIDVSKAKVPENYPFTMEQVLDAVATCVKLMYPPRAKDEGALEIEILR
ncbi:hypothetical protein [Haloferula sp.]|uniref:hypothetical protein n=1 Tax=Haloferula sp. TaxID=2497595 RepID=UPI0032A07D3B